VNYIENGTEGALDKALRSDNSLKGQSMEIILRKFSSRNCVEEVAGCQRCDGKEPERPRRIDKKKTGISQKHY